MNLKEMNLGKAGLEYLASSLAGWPGLCSKIPWQLEQVGDVFALLPAGTARERALQFETGGLMSWRETCVWFARELEQLNGRTANGTLVFQDLIVRPQDRVSGKYEGVFFDQSGAVYYILGAQDMNAAAISRMMLQIRSFLLVAVFCNLSFRAADVPATRVLDETLIDAMANNAQEVFVSAYDYEGLVVWRKA